MEINQEIELSIKSAKKFDNFLKSINIPLAVTKVKKGAYFKYNNFQIELVEIPGLGPFLEIETVVADGSEISKAKKALHGVFKKLGFSPRDFEKRYYLEMLYD